MNEEQAGGFIIMIKEQIVIRQGGQKLVQVHIAVDKLGTFTSEISVQAGLNWKIQQAKLRNGAIQIPSKGVISVIDITKIKCLSDEIIGKSRKIKICHRTIEDLFFAAQFQKMIDGLPLQYGWFYRIVNLKLEMLGINLQKTAAIEGKQFKVPVQKIHTKGFIYKRSQFLKKWEQRFTVIGPQGLFSFKNPSEDHSFSIKAKQIKYIWTRFDMHNGCLIVKVMHGLQKTQFAVPILNYGLRTYNNWLLGFYQMMLERNIMMQT